MAMEFEVIAFIHIPQNRNEFPDALAILASLDHISARKGLPNIKFINQIEPAYGNYIKKISDELPQIKQTWYQDIKEYMCDVSTPTEMGQVEGKRIHKMAMKFYLSRDALYKRDTEMGFLSCLDKD